MKKFTKETIIFDWILPIAVLIAIVLVILVLTNYTKKIDIKQQQINKIGDQINFGAWKPEIVEGVATLTPPSNLVPTYNPHRTCYIVGKDRVCDLK